MTRDISDGVRCDTEISVDVVSVRSLLVARRLTPLLKLDLTLLISSVETLTFLSGAPLIDRLHDISSYIHRRPTT